MKTYDLIDRVTEQELLAVTLDGAHRWFGRNGWKSDGTGLSGEWFRPPVDGVLVCLPNGHAPAQLCAMLNRIADYLDRPARTVLDEMTTDSRIVAEIGRVTGKTGLAALAAKENER